jgi:glycosyltransferase involved in cell wall biosynthesis
MRVLIVESAGNLWGSERALLDLIDGVSRCGVQLGVCCPPDRPLQAELENRHLPVHPTFVYELHQKGKWARLRAALGLLRAGLAFKPDLIYLNQAGAGRIASVVARLLKVPVVAHVRIYEDADYLARLNPSKKWLAGLIAISQSIAEEIKGKPGLSEIPITILYDAFQMTTPVDDRDSSAPRDLCLMACVGRLTPIKGQDLLIEALGLLSAEQPPLTCTILGTGEAAFTAALQKRAETLQANQMIHWAGFSNAVADHLRQANVLVCPSHREPLGRVIFEAWDSGCLPLAFAGSGGAAEVIAASGGGVLYAEQRPQCLAEALGQTLALPKAERDAMLNKGRAWMQEQLSVPRYGQAVTGFFQAAVTTARHP